MNLNGRWDLENRVSPGTGVLLGPAAARDLILLAPYEGDGPWRQHTGETRVRIGQGGGNRDRGSPCAEQAGKSARRLPGADSRDEPTIELPERPLVEVVARYRGIPRDGLIVVQIHGEKAEKLAVRLFATTPTDLSNIPLRANEYNRNQRTEVDWGLP
ncbi:hypothetical protein SAMD00023353_4800680 [Rosellinia necatrix]|uniref:Uncharacterized protein n=1 Tax=Rosellinia necatrix TaxID=77044 RepID=A0A1S8AA10_ROSNE|nr:hypothetical protein SAMD00023353_4800680 [Rosellinia necatrix]